MAHTLYTRLHVVGQFDSRRERIACLKFNKVVKTGKTMTMTNPTRQLRQHWSRSGSRGLWRLTTLIVARQQTVRTLLACWLIGLSPFHFIYFFFLAWQVHSLSVRCIVSDIQLCRSFVQKSNVIYQPARVANTYTKDLTKVTRS